MKKITAAVFAALALPAIASAAQVEVFGKIDLGLLYTHTDAGVGASEDTLALSSGNFLASRFGLKGSEKISDTTTVGFLLENGFQADSGAMNQTGRLFDRGSWLYVRDTNAGELAAGRIGILRSSAADYSYFLLGARISPFGSGWSAVGSPMYVTPFFGVLKDNTLSYVSPSMNGVKVHVQYAMGDNEENKSSSDRYYGVAVTYDNSNFQLVALLDTLNEKSYSTATNQTKDAHDAWTLTLGGNMTFGWGKAYAWGQYFEDANTLMGLPGLSSYKPFQNLDRIKGWTASAAVSFPLAGGDMMAQASYLNADYKDDLNAAAKAATGDELSRYVFSMGYRYHLSKTLKLYAAGTYYKDVVANTGAGAGFKNPSVVQLMGGLCYFF